ncbi:MAG: hypothetical protein D6711_07405, partial [Chloroflexi bacterium]
MWANIIKTLSRIFNDLLELNNIEKYVIAFAALGFAVLGLFDDVVSNDLKMSAILAALGLLVFNLTRPEQDGTASLDHFLNDRQDLPKLSDTLANVQELWVYAPSAANLLRGDNLGVIKDKILKNPNGHLRILIQNPDEQLAVTILQKHLDEGVVEQNNQSMPHEIQETLKRLASIRDEKRLGKLSYGLMPYGLGFSILIFNPNKSDAFLILEIHGFRNKDTRARMHIRITRRDSERWYDYWKNQMIAMWNDAQG